ncbi:uncharacterized protein V1510DRAFT_412955 [Dipodascopsis tothii]|uniref:uncharacterized protein n=1 Tax=Dipodascopsis tothii TaxID=44089 RepID=UPI0034CF1554
MTYQGIKSPIAVAARPEHTAPAIPFERGTPICTTTPEPNMGSTPGQPVAAEPGMEGDAVLIEDPERVRVWREGTNTPRGPRAPALVSPGPRREAKAADKRVPLGTVTPDGRPLAPIVNPDVLAEELRPMAAAPSNEPTPAPAPALPSLVSGQSPAGRPPAKKAASAAPAETHIDRQAPAAGGTLPHGLKIIEAKPKGPHQARPAPGALRVVRDSLLAHEGVATRTRSQASE